MKSAYLKTSRVYLQKMAPRAKLPLKVSEPDWTASTLPHFQNTTLPGAQGAKKAIAVLPLRWPFCQNIFFVSTIFFLCQLFPVNSRPWKSPFGEKTAFLQRRRSAPWPTRCGVGRVAVPLLCFKNAHFFARRYDFLVRNLQDNQLTFCKSLQILPFYFPRRSKLLL